MTGSLPRCGTMIRMSRWLAALALGEMKDRRAVEPLIRALSDAYQNVRKEAAWALGAIGDSPRDDSTHTAAQGRKLEYPRTSSRGARQHKRPGAVAPLTTALRIPCGMCDPMLPLRSAT